MLAALLVGLTAGAVALGDRERPAPAHPRDAPWFGTLREALLDRASRDGIEGRPLYTSDVADGLGPVDVSRRPAISDGEPHPEAAPR